MIFISKNLELLRKKAGLKQAELAEKLNVKANTISNYEKGVSNPDYVIIRKLMDLFKITSDQLLYSDLSSEEISRNSINETVSESVFDKFLAKMDEKDRKLDEKDAKIDQLQTELRQLFEELTILKAEHSHSQDKEPDHPSLTSLTDSFIDKSLGDYGGDSLPMNQPTDSKTSLVGKT